jgi:cytochrome c-type biogenesis protein CcmH/NrfG
MEVAMPSFLSKVFISVSSIAAASALMLSGSGCADALVYAKDAHNQGMELYNEGDYADAAGAFENATRQDPRDYSSYYYLGACYDQMHDYREAISAYHSSLDVMGLTLAGQHDQATRDRALDALAGSIAHSPSVGVETVAMEQKCKANPTDVEDQWLLAKVYRYSGDADAAVDAYNKAVLVGSKKFALTKEAGMYEESLGQTQRATFALRQANAVNPDDPQVTAALHRLGVTPGMTVKDDRDLAASPAFSSTAAQPASLQVPRE